MKDTVINVNSWHYKIYMFGVSLWGKFIGSRKWENIQLNHCMYIRMFFYLIFILIPLHLFVYLSPIWISYLIYSWYGLVIFGELLSWIAIIIAVLVSIFIIIAIINFLSEYLSNKSHEKESKKINEKKETEPLSDKKKEVENDGDSLLEIIKEFLKDHHDQICRPIKVINKEEGK
jgi:predicted membrane protein